LDIVGDFVRQDERKSFQLRATVRGNFFDNHATDMLSQGWEVLQKISQEAIIAVDSQCKTGQSFEMLDKQAQAAKVCLAIVEGDTLVSAEANPRGIEPGGAAALFQHHESLGHFHRKPPPRSSLVYV
jgi:hypothetical protein